MCHFTMRTRSPCISLSTVVQAVARLAIVSACLASPLSLSVTLSPARTHSLALPRSSKLSLAFCLSVVHLNPKVVARLLLCNESGRNRSHPFARSHPQPFTLALVWLSSAFLCALCPPPPFCALSSNLQVGSSPYLST